MSQYAVIVENDESEWDDLTGEYYHFPKRYKGILEEGTQVVYYKSGMTNSAFEDERLSKDPHYFGIAEVEGFYPDERSTKGDLYASIKKLKLFEQAVPFKINGEYLEHIPENRESNYFRDAVREIGEDEYNSIIDLAEIEDFSRVEAESTEYNVSGADELTSREEGNKKKVLTTKYERDPRLRKAALEIHGYDCKACGFNFENVYGERGKHYIHVHHIKPISEYNSPREVDPDNDLTVLCPNCHAMVHRYREETLTVEELKKLLK